MSTNTLFRRGAEDAPLDFTFFKKGQDFQKTARVYLGLDPNDSHSSVCGTKPGKWKWWTTVSDYTPTIPPGRPPGGSPTPTPGGTTPPPTIPPLNPLDAAGRLQAYLARVSDSVFGSILGRPQLIVTGAPDLRKTTNGVPDALMNAIDAITPVVARMEPWGKQSANAWVYTDTPGKSRFVGGTANGGWAIMPPELDMADQSSSFAPVVRSKSTTYLAVVTGVYFAAGLPDISTGAIKTGYQWSADTTGNLNFDQVNSSGTIVTAAITFDTSQRILWKSGTSFTGRLGHSNTAARIYTFPDIAGTVLVASSPSSGIMTSGSIAFAGSDGLLTQRNANLFWDDTNFNLGIGTTAQFGGGQGGVGIANSTRVPNANPSGGGVLYGEGGALKWRGSSGTVTTIAPA